MNNKDEFDYELITNNVQVKVRPIWIEENTIPEENIYFWAYIVKIINLSSMDIKLMRRYWCITNSEGKKTEVKGDGVIGEQPNILVGKSYKYCSGTSLDTPSGFMYGMYYINSKTQKDIEIVIPSFSLDCPYQKVSMN